MAGRFPDLCSGLGVWKNVTSLTGCPRVATLYASVGRISISWRWWWHQQDTPVLFVVSPYGCRSFDKARCGGCSPPITPERARCSCAPVSGMFSFRPGDLCCAWHTKAEEGSSLSVACCLLLALLAVLARAGWFLHHALKMDLRVGGPADRERMERKGHHRGSVP